MKKDDKLSINDMENTDPFEEYQRESDPTKRERSYAWHTAIGLQAVDGMETSDYLKETAVKNIDGEITIKEVEALIHDTIRIKKQELEYQTI